MKQDKNWSVISSNGTVLATFKYKKEAVEYAQKNKNAFSHKLYEVNTLINKTIRIFVIVIIFPIALLIAVAGIFFTATYIIENLTLTNFCIAGVIIWILGAIVYNLTVGRYRNL